MLGDLPMSNNLPMWRSLLFVPVTQRRFIDGAARRGADAIILDLEDSVAASEKERAREAGAGGGRDRRARRRRCRRPHQPAAAPGGARHRGGGRARRAWRWRCPKTESPEHVRLLAEIVDEVEAERGMAPGTTRLIAMVETAAAFFRIAEIAARPSAAVRPHARRRGFRHLGRHPARCRGAVDAEADGGVRRPRRRDHAVGLYRLDRRIPRPRRLPADDPPLAPVRLCRRLGDPSEPSADPERGIPRRVSPKSITRAACSPPMIRRWPRGWVRSPSTAR